MAIVNQDLGTSQKRQYLDFTFGAVTNGATMYIGMVPFLCNMDLVQLTAYGISGSPAGQIWIDRFIPGSGETTFVVGGSFALGAFGTSGVLSVSVGVSLPQMGATLNVLLPNDVLVYRQGVANSAILAIVGGVVLRPLNDHIKWFGIL